MKGARSPAEGGWPTVGRVRLSDLRASLMAGVHDFRAVPRFGVVFGVIYALGGVLLIRTGGGGAAWVLTLGFAFPLVAPFAALGLYEVSRRREAGERPGWAGLGSIVASARRARRLGGFALLLGAGVLAWYAGALALAGVFLGRAGFAAASGWATAGFVLAELIFGGLIAFGLYAVSVFGLPLCLDRDLDIPFLDALRLSVATVRESPLVLTIWAFVVAGLLLVAVLPAFFGLLAVLPVLGHASWHLYRRALYREI